MDNIDVAILTKLNALAERFGVKPYDFVATMDNSVEMDGCGLSFVIPVDTSAKQAAKVKDMFRALGVSATSPDEGILKGGDITLINTLDKALQHAPKPPQR